MITEDLTAAPLGALAEGHRDEGPHSSASVIANEVKFAVSFTRVISVLAKSAPYRDAPLSHIEQFILPPLLAGQFAILDTQIEGRRVPVAVAFWANVSSEVDRRLSDTSGAAILQPADWRSGELTWLIDVIGQPDASVQLMRQLQLAVFKNRDVKMRRKGPDGQLVVSNIYADDSHTVSREDGFQNEV